MAHSKSGKLRDSVKKMVDAMSLDVAVDLLATRSNRCASFDYLEEYCDAWARDSLKSDMRWIEIEYAEIAACDKLGLVADISWPVLHLDDKCNPADFAEPEWDWGGQTSTCRCTKRFEYETTDSAGQPIIAIAHI